MLTLRDVVTVEVDIRIPESENLRDVRIAAFTISKINRLDRPARKIRKIKKIIKSCINENFKILYREARITKRIEQKEKIRLTLIHDIANRKKTSLENHEKIIVRLLLQAYLECIYKTYLSVSEYPIRKPEKFITEVLKELHRELMSFLREHENTLSEESYETASEEKRSPAEILKEISWLLDFYLYLNGEVEDEFYKKRQELVEILKSIYDTDATRKNFTIFRNASLPETEIKMRTQ